MTRFALILVLAAATLGVGSANAQTLPCGNALLSMAPVPCTAPDEVRQPAMSFAQATSQAGSAALGLVRHPGGTVRTPEPTLTALLVDSPGAPFAF